MISMWRDLLFDELDYIGRTLSSHKGGDTTLVSYHDRGTKIIDEEM